MLPTHGAVTSVFHLANSVRHQNPSGLTAWVNAAGSRSSFLAAAIDHRPTAVFLLEAGLAVASTGITLNPRLRAMSRIADRHTLVAIAELLLETAPPPWLPIAVVSGVVHYEFIPTDDFAGLEWLRPELDQLLVDSSDRTQNSSDTVALGLGRAAELVIFAALDRLGVSPTHVADISDRFGYDIESAFGPTRRWEVKGCTSRTRESFHLSRNEFDQCRRYRDEWRLVQVEFSPSTLTAESITDSHISMIRELASDELLSIPPRETREFYWEASARVAPRPHVWVQSTLVLPEGFQIPSLLALGAEVRERRRASSIGRD